MQSRNDSRVNQKFQGQNSTSNITSPRIPSNSNSTSNLPKSTTTQSVSNSGQKSQFHHDSYLLNPTSPSNNPIIRNSSLPGLPTLSTDTDSVKQPMQILTETSEGTIQTYHTPSPINQTNTTTTTKPVLLPSFTSGLSSPKEAPAANNLNRILGNKNNENQKPNPKSPNTNNSFKGINNQFAGNKPKEGSGTFNKMPQGKPFSNFSKPSTSQQPQNNNKAGVLNVNRNIQQRPTNSSISTPKQSQMPNIFNPQQINTGSNTSNAANTPTGGYNSAIQSYLSTLSATNPLFLQALSNNPMYSQLLNSVNNNTPSTNTDQILQTGTTLSTNKSTVDTNTLNTSEDQHNMINLANADPTFLTSKKLALQLPENINEDSERKEDELSHRELVGGTGIVKFDLSHKKSQHASNKSKAQPVNLSTTPLKYEFDDAHKGIIRD